MQYSKCPVCSMERVSEDRCERCGAKKINGQWKKICETCHQEVADLHGLFVPHLCKACMDKVIERDKVTGNICSLCGSVRSLCCC